MGEQERIPCAREGCNRWVWSAEKTMCSAVCHFAATQLENSYTAATQFPDEKYTTEWYQSAVLLNNLVTELTDFKKQHSRNIGRRNGYAKGSVGQ